jgi:predicted HTH transcriptional regulator
MYLAGYIERMGTGTGDIIRLCIDQKLKEPEFRQEEEFVTTIWRKDGNPPPITELERKLLEIISQNPKGNREEFAGKLGITTGVVKEYINRLKQKGILERHGNNRRGYWEIKCI